MPSERKINKLLMLIKFVEAEFKSIFTTSPFENTLRKVTFLLTLFLLAEILGYIAFELRLPILFILPIILGVLLAHMLYKIYGELLKSATDFALYLVATITSAYLVINTASLEVDFFDHYMRNGAGYIVTNIFAVAGSARCYITAQDLYNNYNLYKDKKVS